MLISAISALLVIPALLSVIARTRFLKRRKKKNRRSCRQREVYDVLRRIVKGKLKD